MALSGRIAEMSEETRQLLLERTTSSDPVVRERVAGIVERVRRDGDGALRALAAGARWYGCATAESDGARGAEHRDGTCGLSP